MSRYKNGSATRRFVGHERHSGAVINVNYSCRSLLPHEEKWPLLDAHESDVPSVCREGGVCQGELAIFDSRIVEKESFGTSPMSVASTLPSG